MRLFFSALIWLACIPAGFAGPEVLGPRTFTDVDGRTIEAEIVALRAQEVTVRRRADGREFTLPFVRLSTQDQIYLGQHRAEIDELTAALPETDFTRALREDFALPDARGFLAPIPAETWRRTRRFVLVEGVPENEKAVGEVAALCAKGAGSDAAVLWIGPYGETLSPNSDQRAAQWLPRGWAVLKRAAMDQALKHTRQELQRIGEEEAPGRPDLLLPTLERRSPEERRRMRDVVKAGLPPYWSTAGFVYTLEPTRRFSPAMVYVRDRDGQPLPDEEVRLRALTGGNDGFWQQVALAPGPARSPQTEWRSSFTPAAEPWQLGDPVAKRLTLANGREVEVYVLALGRSSVVVCSPLHVVMPGRQRSCPPQLVRLLALEELSEPDRIWIEQLRGDPRYAAASVQAAPLPAREIGDVEISRARRFVPAAWQPANTHTEFLRWKSRPTLVIEAAQPEEETAVRAAFEAMCTAAGLLTDPRDAKYPQSLTVRVGTFAFVNAARQPSGNDDGTTHTWRYRYTMNPDGFLETMRVRLVLGSGTTGEKHAIARAVARGFGALGESDEFRASLFGAAGNDGALSVQDQHLFRFIYRHVRPGMRSEDVVRLVNERWARLEEPATAVTIPAAP